MISGLNRLVRRFWLNRRGNYAVIVAIAAIPLFGAVGLAVDVTRALETKSRLANAADAAVLASLASGSPAMTQAMIMTGPGPIATGKQDSETFFKSNLRSDLLSHVYAVESDVRRGNSEVTSELKYQASVATSFARVLGIDSWPVQGTAKASISIDAAIDFYVLLDNTPSMGLGATNSDIDKLVANTPDKCAFACHALNNSDNYYNLAKKIGVQMRIDVVRQATQNLMDRAKKVRTYANQFRMAVYTFGAAATNMGLTQISGLSHDLDKVKSAAGAVDLMTIPYQNYNNDQQTDFDGTLTALNKLIAKPGTGKGGDESQKVVFFVSDGVGDSNKPYTCTKKVHQSTGRCQEPIAVDYCAKLKARGIKVAVLYTTYLPLPSNDWYNKWIKPFQNEIGVKMKECASPGLFFEVSPSEGISEAMDALFMKTISVLRLVG
jgi:hypothetical protein